MKRKVKKKLPKPTKYRSGGDINDTFRNIGLGLADTALTSIGASNVITDDEYTGYNANSARKFANIAGGLGKAVLPIAANVIAPGSGQYVSMGQNVISQYNPQPYNPSQQVYKYGGCMECGGKMMTNGGVNAELEKEENVITPNGDFVQFNGPSHEQGGIPTSLPNNTIVFSDKLKSSTGKTFAKANKKNNTTKEDKILDNQNSSRIAKKTAELMKFVKQRNSQQLFEEQESLKADKLNKSIDRVIKKYGGEITSGVDPIEFKSGGWIKKASDSIKRRGTEGKCTPITKPDCTGKAKVLALTFKKIARNRKEDGGVIQYPNGGIKLPTTLTPNLTHYLTPGQVPYTPQDLVKYGYNPVDKEGTQYEDSKGNIYIYKPIKYNEEGWNNPQNPYSKNQPKGVWKGQKGILKNGGLVKYWNGGPVPFDPDYKAFMGPINPDLIYNQNTVGLAPNASEAAQNELNQADMYNDVVVPGYDSKPNPNVIAPYNDGSYLDPSTLNSKSRSNIPWKDIGTNVLYGVANNAGYLYDLYRSKGVEQEQFNPLSPKLLDPTETLRAADIEARKSVQDLSNISNRGSYLGSRIAQSTANTLNKAGIRQSFENQNVGIQNQFAQYNQEQDWRTKMYNAQGRAQQRNLRSNAIGNIGQNVAAQTTDNRLIGLDRDKIDLIKQMNPAVLNDPEFIKILQKYSGGK